ncbi:MAG: hypothetical protein R3F11_15705 [Verrucomicrobiales bacterium]
MNRHLILALSVLAAACAQAAPPAERWIYSQTNLMVDQNCDDLIALMKRGKAAGYNAVLVSDSKFGRLATLGDNYFDNARRVKAAAEEIGIAIVPAVCPIGYSNELLFNDPNLIEGPPVKDALFEVRGGIARHLPDPAVALKGGDMAALSAWDWKDDSVTADGGAAKAMPAGGNARLVQKLKLTPFRQYHIAVRVKTRDFTGEPEVKLLAEGGRSLNHASLGVKRTQDWAEHHVVFNSLEHAEANLYLGSWGGTGELWWDDATLEEIALVNLIRRPGAPLRIQIEGGRDLVEGHDFAHLADPLTGVKPWPGEYESYHQPPAIQLKGVADGTRLRVSYYHAITVGEGQAMACPSEPGTDRSAARPGAADARAVGARGYMMSHDEVRVLNWCDACQRQKRTPDQILAENVKQCAAIWREVNPGGTLYVWSDMFDPHHNAVAGPTLVNGDLRGAWEGLDKDIVILPWNFGTRAESLEFFAGRGHRQLIAGYYDADPAKLRDWLKAAEPHGGSVIGVMHTTWRKDYSNLETFAEMWGR